MFCLCGIEQGDGDVIITVGGLGDEEAPEEKDEFPSSERTTKEFGKQWKLMQKKKK